MNTSLPSVAMAISIVRKVSAYLHVHRINFRAAITDDCWRKYKSIFRSKFLKANSRNSPLSTFCLPRYFRLAYIITSNFLITEYFPEASGKFNSSERRGAAAACSYGAALFTSPNESATCLVNSK